jgi:DHA2 family metal-tetracycline-proton antiporter-like MFS transporter
MGLMSMLNFMAGAVSAGLYSKVVDHGASIRWNPINDRPEAYVFGNLYLLLAAATLIIAAIFFARFGRPVNHTKQQRRG